MIEQLYTQKRVPREGEALLSLDKGNLLGLVGKLAPSKVIGFSTLGKPTLMKTIARASKQNQRPL